MLKNLIHVRNIGTTPMSERPSLQMLEMIKDENGLTLYPLSHDTTLIEIDKRLTVSYEDEMISEAIQLMGTLAQADSLPNNKNMITKLHKNATDIALAAKRGMGNFIITGPLRAEKLKTAIKKEYFDSLSLFEKIKNKLFRKGCPKNVICEHEELMVDDRIKYHFTFGTFIKVYSYSEFFTLALNTDIDMIMGYKGHGSENIGDAGIGLIVNDQEEHLAIGRNTNAKSYYKNIVFY